ncbi:hypothetical protein LTR37_010863 [Vermiconidia calcicola]|uniref:Uncharacterized protein n=1 Tax=Vermiconidia calcicola TaxID=1690605 RepID=A0ACC3N4Z2_9PEZI|nr:hypothetical protein LTR37_010863 [Vermiconidia calcicola]
MEASPLNKLPSELLNDIYELVFTQPGPITVTFRNYHDPLSGIKLSDKKPTTDYATPTRIPHVFALAYTCKQTRVECDLLRYRCNEFGLTPSNQHQIVRLFDAFEEWLGREKLAAMKSIVFETGYQPVFGSPSQMLHIFKELLWISKLRPSYNLYLALRIPREPSSHSMQPALRFVVDIDRPKEDVEEILKACKLQQRPTQPWHVSLAKMLERVLELWLEHIRASRGAAKRSVSGRRTVRSARR